MIVTLLFVISALSFSGFVSAGGKHDTGPYGVAYFNKDTYTLGETMYIIIKGNWGHAQKGWFELTLKNPSGQVVERLAYPYELYPTGFTVTETWTAGQTGTWIAEYTYNTAGKKMIKTTPMGIDEALVI